MAVTFSKSETVKILNWSLLKTLGLALNISSAFVLNNFTKASFTSFSETFLLLKTYLSLDISFPVVLKDCKYCLN